MPFHRRCHCIGILITTCAVCCVNNAGAQSIQCQETARLTAAHPFTGDAFGSSLAVSGDVAVIGAVYDDCPAGNNCGAAYVFRNNGTSWVPEQRLRAVDATEFGLLGSAAATDGNVIVVGAGGDDCAAGLDCGAVYVFRYDDDTWIQEQKLTASDASAGAAFGRSVSISGDVIAVGALWDDCSDGVDCGSAYVFRFNGTGWFEQKKLTAGDARADTWFGRSVSLNREVLLIGAALDSCATGSHCGSAYVFRDTGKDWVQEQKLTPSDAGLAVFGFSVSTTPTVALVGAMLAECSDGLYCGAAYAFRYDGESWVQEQKIVAADTKADDLFGSSVSIHQNTALIGARTADCADGTDCGSAYVFRYDGSSWVEKRRLAASDAAAADWLGWFVSLSGSTAMVGAWRDDCPDGAECGSAYVFSCVCDLAGDVQDDCDVDLFDYAAFACCASQSSSPECDPNVPRCDLADFDRDGDVDLADFGSLQLVFPQ